jgi:hypothetical protein
LVFPAPCWNRAGGAPALVFTVAVLRSQALRPLTPQFEDFGEDHEDFEEEDA